MPPARVVLLFQMAKTKELLNDAQLKTVRMAIDATYDQIGSDLGADDDEQAIEGCLDADRLSAFADKGKEAYDILRPLYKEHGYVAVLKYLAKKIHLV